MNFKLIVFIISCIVGSGILFSPCTLGVFGINSFVSFFIVLLVSMYIGFVFASRGSIFLFLEQSFGRTVSAGLAWMYWILCWSGTIVVLNECFRYLSIISPSIHNYSFIVKSFLVSFCILLNLKKNKFQEVLEISTNILKASILIGFPVLCFLKGNVSLSNLSGSLNLTHISAGIPKIIWSFLGIEIGAMISKEKNANQSILIAIFIVGCIYLANLVAVWGILGYKVQSYSPYVDIMQLLFGSLGTKILTYTIFFINMVSLNLWLITGGSIGVDCAKVGYFPEVFLKKNKSGVYSNSIILSSIGLIPLSLFSANKIIQDGIDYSCNLILVFYLTFLLANFKIHKSITSMLISILILMYFVSLFY